MTTTAEANTQLEAVGDELARIISRATNIRYADPNDLAGCAFEAYHYLFQSLCNVLRDLETALRPAGSYEDEQAVLDDDRAKLRQGEI